MTTTQHATIPTAPVSPLYGNLPTDLATTPPTLEEIAWAQRTRNPKAEDLTDTDVARLLAEASAR